MSDLLKSGVSWTSLWYGYIMCGRCGGIRKAEGSCPVCADPLPVSEQVMMGPDGEEIRLCAVFMGAEGRYEDYIYLQMIEREWKRPLPEVEEHVSVSGQHPSPRAAIVLLFWSYFETRIERLLRAGMRGTPAPLVEDTMDRYSSIGARLDRLYRVVFGSTYGADLKEAGYLSIWSHLCEIQQKRNAFMHGNPVAIDDNLVTQVVLQLKDEHEAWIAIFNKRATRWTAP